MVADLLWTTVGLGGKRTLGENWEDGVGAGFHIWKETDTSFKFQEAKETVASEEAGIP